MNMHRFKETISCAILTGAVALSASGARGETLVEVETAASPAKFEASDLLLVQNRRILETEKWDRGFWTVSDEKDVEKNLALVGHEKGAPLEEGWRVEPVQVQTNSTERTDDAEVLCRRGGWIYAIGSHFGKKGGPLKASRQFIARFREQDMDIGEGHCSVSMEIHKDRFLLHRLINDALVPMRADLIEPTKAERGRFITDARREGAEEGRDWVPRLAENDWPLNIEGADFVGDGSLLIGLRYPVSRAGHPLLVKIERFEDLFAAPDKTPRVACVHIIENVGNERQLTGIRSLRVREDRVHIITGTIDSRPELSLLLQQHPEGGQTGCAHYEFPVPANGSTRVRADRAHVFDQTQNVEGIAFDNLGRAFYVRDAKGKTPLLFWRTD